MVGKIREEERLMRNALQTTGNPTPKTETFLYHSGKIGKVC